MGVKLSVVVPVPFVHALLLTFNTVFVQELVLKICKPGLSSILADALVAILLNAMVGNVDWAVNLYQTSGVVAELPQNAPIPEVPVALPVLVRRAPPVVVQVGPEFRFVALLQASLPGCANNKYGKKNNR